MYKGVSNSLLPELQYLSQCLAQQTMAAETITNLIYEKVNKIGMIFGGNKKAKKQKDSPQQCTQKYEKSRVETRMKLLEEASDERFDGNVDSLV